MDNKLFFGDLEKAKPAEQPLQWEKESTRRIRGPENLPAAISKVESPPDGPKPYKGPSRGAIAQMTSKQLEAALKKWPELATRLG